MHKAQKPWQLKLAVALLYLSLFTSVLRTFLSNLFDNQMVLNIDAEALRLAGTYALTTLVFAYFINRISVGRNWARIVYLVLLVIGAGKGMYDLSKNDNLDFWNLLDAMLFVVQFYVIYLLAFSPAKKFFKRKQI